MQGAQGLIPGQGSRFHMLQLRPNTVKEINKNKYLKKNHCVLELRSYLVLVQVVGGDRFIHTGVNFMLFHPWKDSGCLNISVQLKRVLDPHNSKVGSQDERHQLHLGAC